MAINMNNHVFKGHKTLLGSKYVTYAEVELSTKYDIFPKSKNGFDWGNPGSGSLQLSFAILHQLSDAEFAEEYATKYMNEVIRKLSSRDWIINASDVIKWIKLHKRHDEQKKEIESNVQKEEKEVKLKPSNNTKDSPARSKRKKASSKPRPKTNVVKEICKELDITQKTLAEILEVPEGTVSSWAVKNEIPRLGKKAIEFYIQNTKNQKIIDSYKSFVDLLKAS